MDWIAQMKLLIDYLGKENIYISILENGDSKDNTRTFLKDFQQYLNENSIPNKIILDHIIKRTNKERIVYLAQLRDLSLQYLYQIEDLDFSQLSSDEIAKHIQDFVLIGSDTLRGYLEHNDYGNSYYFINAISIMPSRNKK